MPGSVGEYIDLNDTKILIHLQILRADGKSLDATDKVAFVNLPISSVFQDVFLSIGDKQIEGGQHCYPYNGYLSSLLQFHPSAKKTHMLAWGWNEDEPGKFNDETNAGYAYRNKETANSKEWELQGPLFLDLTRQSRFLLPQTNLRFKFMQAKPEFVLQRVAGTTDYKYRITKAILYIRRMRVKESVISGHNRGLKSHNAVYNTNHVDLTSFTITKGNRDFIKDRLFTSQTPKLLVVGFLDHAAFNGDISKNPFDFQHFDLNKIGLYRGGELVPGQILRPDFQSGHFIHSYANTMNVLNFVNTDDSNGLTPDHFKDGYTLFCFDLTPDAQCNAPYRSIHYNSSLRLEMSFNKALTKTISVLLFAIFDSKLEITELRDCILSYNR